MKKYLIYLSIIIIALIGGLYFYFDQTNDIPKTSIEHNIGENTKNDIDKNVPLNTPKISTETEIDQSSKNKSVDDDSIKEKQDNNLITSSKISKKVNDVDQVSNKSLPNINMIWITIFSLIVALISILVSLYLYYWRYKLIINKEFLIPEKVVSVLGTQSNEFSQLSQFNVQVAKLIENHTKKSDNDITELKDILIQFQKSLNEKDQVISRYKQGYDNKIFKDYIGRFYRIYKFLTDLDQKQSLENSDLKKLKTLFDDAFDQSGVEVFYPSIGINYLDEGEILDDNPIIKLTDNENDDNKVIEVNNPGLRFVDKQIDNRILIKSKVTILQYKKD